MPDDNSPYSVISRLLQKTSTDSMSWNIDDVTDQGKNRSIAFLNAHALNQASQNADFAHFLLSSDFLLRDGIGIKLALKLFRLPVSENLNGTDLIPKILKKYHDKKIAIFGASMDALEGAKQRMKSEGVNNIISLEHGFHDFAVYMDACKTNQPDIIVLCMGMPKQELLAAELIKQNMASLIICGGGWADFYSGVKKRAPLWIQKLSLEWVYRLVMEPKRLGKRYTIDILYYFYMICMAWMIESRKT